MSKHSTLGLSPDRLARRFVLRRRRGDGLYLLGGCSGHLDSAPVTCRSASTRGHPGSAVRSDADWSGHLVGSDVVADGLWSQRTGHVALCLDQLLHRGNDSGMRFASAFERLRYGGH